MFIMLGGIRIEWGKTDAISYESNRYLTIRHLTRPRVYQFIANTWLDYSTPVIVAWQRSAR